MFKQCLKFCKKNKVIYAFFYREKVIHKLSTSYPQRKNGFAKNVDNFCTKEFTKKQKKSKMWIMWITYKKVIHIKNLVKSRALKSYPQ